MTCPHCKFNSYENRGVLSTCQHFLGWEWQKPKITVTIRGIDYAPGTLVPTWRDPAPSRVAEWIGGANG